MEGWAAALEQGRIKTFPIVRGLPTFGFHLCLRVLSCRVLAYAARDLETYHGRYREVVLNHATLAFLIGYASGAIRTRSC
jgi:hypothetical protein